MVYKVYFNKVVQKVGMNNDGKKTFKSVLLFFSF